MNEETLEELVPAVRRYAASMAYRACGDRDEFESAAMWGLALGNKTFDRTRGVPYSAYCWKKVRWSVLENMRKSGSIFPLNKTVGKGQYEVADLIADARDDIGEWEGIEQAKHMLETLNPRYRRIMADRFVRGFTGAEVGAAEGCSESRISIIAADASRRMRSALRAA